MKKAKPRKPKPWKYRKHGPVAAWIDGTCIFVDGPLYPSEARRLARWLERAAQYLEQEERE